MDALIEILLNLLISLKRVDLEVLRILKSNNDLHICAGPMRTRLPKLQILRGVDVIELHIVDIRKFQDDFQIVNF